MIPNTQDTSLPTPARRRPWTRGLPWIRNAILGVAALVGMSFLLHHGSDPQAASNMPPTAATGADTTGSAGAFRAASSSPGNGTELLVRAMTIQDPNASQPKGRSYTGTLQARYQAMLGFRVGGKIIARHVQAGERVHQGDVLMQLDCEDAELQLQVAQSDLGAARAQVFQTDAEEKRLVTLLGSQSVGQSDYDLAFTAREVARARLQAAEHRLLLAQNQRAYCDLKADADGLVTQIPTEVGQVVAAGQPVLQWIQGDELEALVSVPETMLSEIKHLRVEITFWSRPGLRIAGRLREVSPVADPASRTYDARFTLLDPPPELALGMTATVHLVSKEYLGIPIPMSAIANANGTPNVWKIASDGSLTAVPIDIVQYESHRALVRGDLAHGDLIASAGVQRLDENCRVRVWKDAP